jgi:putative ABC transport system substrate-binding protein
MHAPDDCSSAGRRTLLGAVLSAALAPHAFAQRTGPVRVGWLGWTGASGTSASTVALEAFRGGLAERGWNLGRDLEIVMRDGDRAQSAALAAELVAQDVQLVVAMGPMVFGARAAVGTRPLVFTINGDPVEAGLVVSMSRPGGTLTGVTALSAELAGKRLELLGETLRGSRRVAVVANEAHPGVAVEREATHAGAKRLGATIAWYPLRKAEDLEPALAAIARDGADALLAIPDNLINQKARQIAEFATPRRLPTISGWSEFVEAGNLMSYGPNPRAYFRQMAGIADRLLRGQRAADVAVEQPREIELVVNTSTARAMSLELPPTLLLRVDRRIA